MFFSRKKQKAEAAATENAAYYAQTIKDTAEALAEAQNMVDAGERYLALGNLEGKLQGLINEAPLKVENEIEEILVRPKAKKARSFAWGSMTTGGTVSVVASVSGIIIGGAAASPLIPLLAIGGMGLFFAGPIAAMTVDTINFSKKNKKKITEGLDDFCASLADLLTRTTALKDAILQEELPALLESRNIGVLCEKFPAVQTAFTKAAIKEGVFTPHLRLDKLQPPKKGN